MNEIKQVSGRAVVVRGHDIDTDRIVPARYLKENHLQSHGGSTRSSTSDTTAPATRWTIRSTRPASRAPRFCW